MGVRTTGTAGLSTRGLAPNTLNAAAGNIGTRIIGGRMERVVTIAATQTFELLIAVAAEFDAVRIILANGYDASGTASISSIQWGAAAVPNTLDATLNGVTYTKDGTTATLARGPAAGRRSFAISNWLPVASVPRDDGGTLPLVNIRAYFPTSVITGMNKSDGSTDFTNWATHPSGRIWRYRYQPIDGLNTPSNFTTVTNRSVSPIVGVQYMARGKVFNLVGVGDSITEAAGATYFGGGWGFDAAVQLSSDFGIPFEWSNLGWSGATIGLIGSHAVDAMAAGLRFDAAFIPNASPNSFSAPITDAEIVTNRGNCAIGRAALQGAGIPSIPWTVLPTNPAVKDYGSSDSKRRALNAAFRSAVADGFVVADFDSALAGTTDGDGQVNMLVGSTSDNIHPNDTGNALLKPLAVNAVKRILAPQVGALVTA